MDPSQKILVESLTNSTTAGKVRWTEVEAVTGADFFQAKLNSGTLHVFELFGPKDGTRSIKLEVYGPSNQLADTILVSEGDDFAALNDLFVAASRSARETDIIFDAILQEIR